MRVVRFLRNIAPYLAVMITLAWIVNFLWTLVLIERDGGSAAVWRLAPLHEHLLWWGLPLLVVSAAYLLVWNAFPALMGMRQGEEVTRRARDLAASGASLGMWWPGGSVCGVSLGWPLMRVEVFPGGLSVGIPLRQPAVILNDEIRGLTWKTGRVIITHTSPDILSTVTINVLFHADLEAALRILER